MNLSVTLYPIIQINGHIEKTHYERISVNRKKKQITYSILIKFPIIKEERNLKDTLKNIYKKKIEKQSA